MRIYLDHNAGAPLRAEAREAIDLFMREGHGNPASVHHAGQRARRALEESRAAIAALIGAQARQVAFTSGGTESNNLAIFGTLGRIEGRRKIVTSSIEHSSVLEPLNELERRGWEIVRVAPDRDGRIAPSAVIDALDDRVAIVTLGLVNAEVGTIQDLAPLAGPIAQKGALFHVDAAQAVGRIPVNAASLGCDLMTLSGHKLGAPAGIGALYVRDSAIIGPRILGGPQENGLRAGTPNLLGAIGFGAAACAIAADCSDEAARVATLTDRLLARLRSSIPGLRLNGSPPFRNTLNLTFPRVLGESMLIALDLEGVEVSMGSACAAGSVEPSHVLLAMGRVEAEARSSLRISLGWSNDASQIDSAAETIARVWRRVVAAEPIGATAPIGSEALS
ncbi:MAG: cysteine desulfurase family protein [Candidatus Binatales bacterium]